MKYLILTFLYIVLISSKCQKEGESCHHSIVVNNSTNSKVLFALRAYNGNLCNLSINKELPSGDETKLSLKYCWESELSDGGKQEIYIVHPTKFNDSEIFYDCDSIEFKNKVLKHYVLSLEDLKAMNFTITYE